MDVDAVGDHAAREPTVVECRAGEAGGPVGKLRHRVEEMGDAARPGLGRRHGGVVGCVAVAEADDDAAVDEAADLPGRRGFDRDRQQQGAEPGIEQGVDIRVRHRDDQRRVVRPFPGTGEKRALEVEAEHARRPFSERLPQADDRLGAPLGPVGDEGGQAAGRAEHRMRRRDARGPRRGRGLVEEHAAAAVDLCVEKARCERPAADVGSRQLRRQRRLRHHVGDARSVEQHRMGFEEALARKDAGADEGVGSHQIVSVTLRSRLGRSGSQSRARETRSAKA